MRSARNDIVDDDAPRAWWWIVAPLLLGLGWFAVATQIAAAANPNGAYAFLVYYGWLGNSWGAILTNAIAHPLRVLARFFTIGNVDMILGLLLPFFFLPLLAPRWLLLALPPLAQILLMEQGGSELIITMYYGLLFLPGLAVATVDAMGGFSPHGEGAFVSPPPVLGRGRGKRGWSASSWFRWLSRQFPLPRMVAVSLAVGVALAASYALGPFRGIEEIAMRGASPEDRSRREGYDAVLAMLPRGASVAASYAALPHIAARRGAYSTAYAYLGVRQFGRGPYVLPNDLEYLILDVRDAETFAVQFPITRWSSPYATGGPDRLRALVRDFAVVAERDGIALLQRDASGPAVDDRYLTADLRGRRGALVVDALRDVTMVWKGLSPLRD